jgi:hypothetical protein
MRNLFHRISLTNLYELTIRLIHSMPTGSGQMHASRANIRFFLRGKQRNFKRRTVLLPVENTVLQNRMRAQFFTLKPLKP